MPDPSDQLERAKLAYDEAKRVVDEQHQAREQFRSRATAVLTVAGLASGLFGFTDLEANPLFWIGLAGLTAVVACVIFLYLPSGWAVNPGLDAVERYIDSDAGHTQASMLENLAIHHQENWSANRATMAKMATATIVLLVGLLVMLGAWTSNAVLADSPDETGQATDTVD